MIFMQSHLYLLTNCRSFKMHIFPKHIGRSLIIALLTLSCAGGVFYHDDAFAGKGNGVDGFGGQPFSEWLSQLTGQSSNKGKSSTRHSSSSDKNAKGKSASSLKSLNRNINGILNSQDMKLSGIREAFLAEDFDSNLLRSEIATYLDVEIDEHIVDKVMNRLLDEFNDIESI